MYGGQTPAEPSESYEITVDAEDEDDKNSLAVSVADAPPAPISKDDPDGTTFCFKDISYSIPGKKGEGDKRVLTDVSATVHAGEVLAIVGPSGAGKTILLDTLTYSKGPGAPAGDITLDGHKMSRSVFVEQAIYVPREDNLWPTMNPRQHLEFAFKNFRPELDADRPQG
jgi:ABC-type multidrug transport system fused ATPase/permease subunit